MTKIDAKDKKILYQLDSDARQSLTQIGKKVGLKKDVVSYRIKRLQDEGIIKYYWTVIDAYRLGYMVFRFYLSFQYVNPEIKKEIIEYLTRDKHTWVIASIKGRWDLSVVIWVKDIRDFYHLWQQFLDKYGDYFEEKIFSIYVQAYVLKQSHLLQEKFDPSDRLHYEIVGPGEKVTIDDLDYQILNELAVNARMPLIELAEKLNCSSQTITYRIKNLIKIGVIQGFRSAIDITKLGLQYFKVDIHLKEYSQRKEIINHVKLNPNIVFIATSAGVSDLELEIYIENSDRLNQLMEEIILKFPGAIKNYDYFSVLQVHKLRCIPEV